MSAAATAAGYLFASGILGRRREAKTLEQQRSDSEALTSEPAESWQKPVKTERAAPVVTYKRRRLP